MEESNKMSTDPTQTSIASNVGNDDPIRSDSDNPSETEMDWKVIEIKPIADNVSKCDMQDWLNHVNDTVVNAEIPCATASTTTGDACHFDSAPRDLQTVGMVTTIAKTETGDMKKEAAADGETFVELAAGDEINDSSIVDFRQVNNCLHRDAQEFRRADRISPVKSEKAECGASSVVIPETKAWDVRREESNTNVVKEEDELRDTVVSDADGLLEIPHKNWARIGQEKPEKSFKCPVCGYECTSRYSMNRHVKVHSSRRKYPCDECGVVFPMQRKLVRHQNQVHLTKEKKEEYSCHLCKRKCPTKDALAAHIDRHQQEHLRLLTQVRMSKESAVACTPTVVLHGSPLALYRCGRCGKIFPTPDCVHLHIKVTHASRNLVDADSGDNRLSSHNDHDRLDLSAHIDERLGLKLIDKRPVKLALICKGPETSLLTDKRITTSPYMREQANTSAISIKTTNLSAFSERRPDTLVPVDEIKVEDTAALPEIKFETDDQSEVNLADIEIKVADIDEDSGVKVTKLGKHPEIKVADINEQPNEQPEIEIDIAEQPEIKLDIVEQPEIKSEDIDGH